MKKDASIFLQHILLNISNIESFTKDVVKKDFLENVEKQYALVRAVEVLGEAVKNISPSFREKYSFVEWKKIAGTRDKLIHHYFGIDLNLLWDVIQKEIPILKKQINRILEQEKVK